jgi:hypothetical protein
MASDARNRHQERIMPAPQAKQIQEIARRFTYHAPHGDQASRYEHIRAMSGQLAQELIRLTPESREQAVALTKLDEVVFWSNAAIARNEIPE